jgi:hydrogenase-1 operon protein HyaF
MKLEDIRIVTRGPGSQPEDDDGQAMDYLPMPRSMAVFNPPGVPETLAENESRSLHDWLLPLRDALACYRIGQTSLALTLEDYDSRQRALLNDVLGEGEVSIRCDADDRRLRIQETAFTGVWWQQTLNRAGAVVDEAVIVGAIPEHIRAHGEVANYTPPPAAALPDGVINAPSVLVELLDHAARYRPGADAYVINLSLLPQTEQDLRYLEQTLGRGAVTILSRGYGNCRISATATANIWWVQYFNSTDALILNTLEVSTVPQVACAAQEDIDDSAARLSEQLGLLV